VGGHALHLRSRRTVDVDDLQRLRQRPDEQYQPDLRFQRKPQEHRPGERAEFVGPAALRWAVYYSYDPPEIGRRSSRARRGPSIRRHEHHDLSVEQRQRVDGRCAVREQLQLPARDSVSAVRLRIRTMASGRWFRRVPRAERPSTSSTTGRTRFLFSIPAGSPGARALVPLSSGEGQGEGVLSGAAVDQILATEEVTPMSGGGTQSAGR